MPNPPEAAVETKAAQSYPCPECGQIFAESRLLGTHRKSKHGVQGSGATALRRRARQAETQRQERRQRAQARVNALQAQQHSHKQKPFSSRNGRGIPCPECGAKYPTPKGLSSHRRNAHGVAGTSKAALWKRSKTAARAAAHSSPVKPIQDRNGTFRCPECDQRGFKSAAHLGRHRRKEHGVEGRSAKYNHSTSNGLMLPHPQGDVHVHQPEGDHHAVQPINAQIVETFAVADLCGQYKSLVSAVANEYDISPKQLARRCLVALSKHYS